MRNYNRDGWSETDWEQLEKAREGAYWAGLEIDAYIGSGGGSFAPENLDDIINAMTNALRRIQAVRANYL